MNQRMPVGPPSGRFFMWGGEVHRGGPDALEWVIFALLLLLVLLVVAQIALSLVRRPRFGGPPRGFGGGGRHGGPPWGRPDPLAVAQVRYARGELDRDSYLQLVQDIGGTPGPPPPPPPPAPA